MPKSDLDSNAGYGSLLAWALHLGSVSRDSTLYVHWVKYRHPQIHEEMEQLFQTPGAGEFIKDYGSSLTESVTNLLPVSTADEAFEAAVAFMEELVSQTRHFCAFVDAVPRAADDHQDDPVSPPPADEHHLSLAA